VGGFTVRLEAVGKDGRVIEEIACNPG